MFIEYGAEPDQQVNRVTNTADGTPFHNYGYTPIYHALRVGDYESATYLLTTGKIKKFEYERTNIILYVLNNLLWMSPHHYHTRSDGDRALAFFQELAKHADMKRLLTITYPNEDYDDQMSAIQYIKNKGNYGKNVKIIEFFDFIATTLQLIKRLRIIVNFFNFIITTF